ncbi:hypothetical protein [Mycoplasmopsis cynos]|uniref:Uncharacterized protein n=1 Tax=Mycoplasmopsis cynos (strain C142) TaxID=1246955 RepID=L0RXL5_MYCC1|nr:hypothetical protein [Mycoplasmopsis cynos]CCP24275.1 Hypothetical protein MCYN_0543 [Mycoplasmopsis cynos C142]
MGSEFIGVLNGYKYYKTQDSNIISIEEGRASELLKLNSLTKLKLVVANMHPKTGEN